MINKFIKVCCILIILILFNSFAVNAATDKKNYISILITDPKDKAVDIDVTKSITVTFNSKIFKGSQYSKINLEKPDKKPVEISVKIDSNTLIIKPSSKMDYLTNYKLTIPIDSIKDSKNNSINNNYILQFTTIKLKADIWTKKSELPDQTEFAAVTVNDKIYLIYNNGRIKAYDPGTNKWSNRYEISEIYQSESIYKVVTVNGKIYIIGLDKDKIFEYDPDHNTCITKTKLPAPRQLAAAAVVSANGNIYLMGGNNYTDSDTADSDNTNFENSNSETDVKIPEITVDMYNPVSGQWTTKSEMPEMIYDPVFTTVDKKIYILNDRSENLESEFLIYDTEKNNWTVKNLEDEIQMFYKIESVNGKIFIIEETANGNNIKEYYPDTNQWRFLNKASISRRFFSTTVCNGKIYVLGGYTFSENEDDKIFVKTIEEYTPPID